MDDIALEVGLKKPTLYHYVKSKAHIVYWIHEDIHQELYHRLQGRISAGFAPRQNILEVIFDILDVMERLPGHLRVYFENHRNLPEELRTEAYEQREVYFSAVRGLVQQGMEEGDLRTANATLTTLALFGMCNWSYQWYRPGGPLSAREVAYHLWELFLDGAALR